MEDGRNVLQSVFGSLFVGGLLFVGIAGVGWTGVVTATHLGWGVHFFCFCLGGWSGVGAGLSDYVA